jgi:hypothetical protein
VWKWNRKRKRNKFAEDPSLQTLGRSSHACETEGDTEWGEREGDEKESQEWQRAQKSKGASFLPHARALRHSSFGEDRRIRVGRRGGRRRSGVTGAFSSEIWMSCLTRREFVSHTTCDVRRFSRRSRLNREGKRRRPVSLFLFFVCFD